ARVQTIEAALESSFTHRVVDHVDALAAREALDLGLEILVGVENHVGGSSLARKLGLGLGGDGGDNARPDVRGHLRKQQAHAASSGVNQRGIAGLERVSGVDKIMRSHALQHCRSRLLHAEALRNFDELRGGHQSVLRIAADDGSGDDRIAGGKSCDAGAELLDRAGSFAAGDQRQGGLVNAFAEIDLDEVDAYGLNAYEDLSRSRLGNGQIGDLEDFGAAS